MIQYNGIPTRIKDIPDAFLRAQFGYGHSPLDIKTRQVQSGDYPCSPQTCLTEYYGAKWINNGTILVCLGYGLDCT